MTGLPLRRLQRSLSHEVPPLRRGAHIEIVAMRKRHLRSVVAIERTIFPRPWSLALYQAELAQPATRAYVVALGDGGVVGYTGCVLVAGEGHITTVGVAPSWHRQGIGRRLLLHLATEARARGVDALTLEVRMSNTGAQRLYHEFGFAPVGVRKNYYAEVNEDGLVMWAGDVLSAAYGDRLEAIAAHVRPVPGPLGDAKVGELTPAEPSGAEPEGGRAGAAAPEEPPREGGS